MATLAFNELNMEKAVRKKELNIVNWLQRCVNFRWILDKSNLVSAIKISKIYLE